MDTVATPALTADDRCDSCGSQAYVVVAMESTNLPLLFCLHHWNQHRAGLESVSRVIVDETDRLVEKPALVETEDN